MSFLNKLIAKKVNGVIKNVTKMDIVIDSLKDKFKDQCPPKAELLAIVKQKNQIQSGLQQVVSVFEPINTTAQTVDGIVTAVSLAVKVIKAIPIPTSFPPGVGIPINVITILSDSLDQLDKLLSAAKLATATVPPVTKVITDAALATIAKLQQLDILFSTCLDESLNDENMEWDPEYNYTSNDSCIYKGNPYASEINNNLNIPPTPATVPGSWQLTTMVSIRENLALEINNVAATSGDFDDLTANSTIENDLLDRLSPNGTSSRGGTNPYIYKGFKFIIQYEAENEFSFPSRRIRAENINTSSENVYKGVVLFNLIGGRYSFSASVQVLINEAKFRIDNLNYNFYWKRWNEVQLDLSNNAQVSRGGELIEEDTTEVKDVSPVLPDTPIVLPTTIVLTQEEWSNWNNLPSFKRQFQEKMYNQNLYKDIPYSIDIGKALQKSSFRDYYYPLTNFGGLREDSSIRLKADVRVPGSEIMFTVDTGKFTPNNIANWKHPGWGNYNPSSGTPYKRGKVTLKINAASGSQYQDVRLLEVDREVKTYTFTYPEIGIYYIEAIIYEGRRGFGNTTQFINANQSSSLIISYPNQPTV